MNNDGLGVALTVASWLLNAAIFVVIGIAVAGFGFIIFDTFFGLTVGVIAGLITFLIAGYLAVKIVNFIFGGIGEVVGKGVAQAAGKGAKKDEG